MLVVSDKSKLGDGRLSGKEALQRSFEDTDRQLQQYRLPDHEQLKDAEARMGRPLSHKEVINRVTKLNSGVWAEDSINDPTVVGFYRKGADGNKEFLVAFDKGYLPEFSIVIVDRADLPVKEKRGWRTVLVRLMAKRALTWNQVLRGFGDTSGTHERSWRWRALTKEFRQ